MTITVSRLLGFERSTVITPLSAHWFASMLVAKELIILGDRVIHLVKNSRSWISHRLVESVFGAPSVPLYEVYDPSQQD